MPKPPANPLSPDVRHLTRTLRERTRYLRHLSANIDQFLAWMDAEMQKPSTYELGSRIAKACNALDLANQHVKRFALRRAPKGKP